MASATDDDTEPDVAHEAESAVGDPVPKRPGKLWAIVVIGSLQAAVNLLFGVLLFIDVSDRLDHNQQVPDGTYLAAVVSVLVFVVIAVCGVLLVRGVAWARVPIAVVEALSILGALYTLLVVSGSGGAVGLSAMSGIALPIGMLLLLFARDVTEWLEPTGATKRAPSLPNVLLAAGVALVVAAAAIAVWFGVSWFRAGNDDSLEFGRERDEVNRVAQGSIATMNTLSYKNVDADLAEWENVTAGALHDEFLTRKQATKDAIVAAKTTTKGEVRSSAVVELNAQTGEATVIAVVRVMMTVEGQAPAEKWFRIQAKLIRTGDGWKLDTILDVPYSQATS